MPKKNPGARLQTRTRNAIQVTAIGFTVDFPQIHSCSFPHPSLELVYGEEPGTTGALAAQDGQLDGGAR